MKELKKDRLTDAEIEAFKAASYQDLDMGGFSTSNIHRSIAVSNFIIIELLERILDGLKKE